MNPVMSMTCVTSILSEIKKHIKIKPMNQRKPVDVLNETYLVHLGLGGLLQRVQNDLQVLLELSADGESDVSKRRQDLGLHGPVHVLVLQWPTQRQAVREHSYTE